MAGYDTSMNFNQENVYLQNFMKSRGVFISNFKEEDIINLCRQDDKLNIELEVRSEQRNWAFGKVLILLILKSTAIKN